MASKRRGRMDFTLGGDTAERDPLLSLAFYESREYLLISSRVDPHCFLIGRTGTGKSAVLRRLEEVHGGHVIRITPEHLSLPYITDLRAVQFLSALDVNLDPLFIALWKHVLIVELIRHRYKLYSADQKQNFLTTIRERVKRDPGKIQALDYLNDFAGKFWCEADERVRQITEKFDEQVKLAAGGQLSLYPLAVEASRETSKTLGTEVRSEQVERYQRLVNETQLARLAKMMTVVDEDMLESDQHFTYVVIDDLDRDWVDDRVVNDLIRCLFRTVIDLQKIKRLKVIVALRTNIFEHLDFGRTGGQEEKFRSAALHLRWDHRDLEAMLDQRVRAATAGTDEGPKDLDDILPRRTKQRGKALDFVFDRTLLRPRDAIAFMNEALARGRGKARLSWDDLYATENTHSYQRLLALRDEWKMSFPGVDQLFQLFKGTKMPMSREGFSRILDDAILLTASPDFPGVRWMTDLATPLLNAGTGEWDWAEAYQPLVNFLYRIGLVGCVRPKGKGIVYYQDDPDYAERAMNLNDAESFVIHPTFRGALDIGH